jgi:hypothetical protein
MIYQRLAYDDQDTTGQMHLDCTACATHITLVAPPLAPELLGDAPSLDFEDFPREVRKPEITVSDAAAHLASRLHLHLD